MRIPAVDVDASMDDVIHGIYLELSQTPYKLESPHPACSLREQADLPAERGGEPRHRC